MVTKTMLMVGGLLLLLLGSVAAVQALEPLHDHTAHDAQITDLAVDEQRNTVWSLDADGGIVGYDIADATVTVTHEVVTGHALAVGPHAVYVASDNTLWAYDHETQTWTSLTTELDSHAAALAYDAERDLVWLAGHGAIYAYNTSSGDLVDSHDEHSDGTSDIAVHENYVVSATAWEREVLVYDTSQDAIVYEPTLPADVTQVSALHITEAGDLLVGTDAEDDSVIAAFHLAAQEQRLTYREHIYAVSDLDYDPVSDSIISFGTDNTIAVYTVGEGAVVERYQHDDTIYAGAFDTTNRLVWFGDGESGPGTVIGLGEPESEPTATEPPANPTATPTQDDPATTDTTQTDTGEVTTDDATTDDPATDDQPTDQQPTATNTAATDDESSLPLVAAIVVLAVLVGGVLYWRR